MNLLEAKLSQQSIRLPRGAINAQIEAVKQQADLDKRRSAKPILQKANQTSEKPEIKRKPNTVKDVNQQKPVKSTSRLAHKETLKPVSTNLRVRPEAVSYTHLTLPTT